MTTSPPTVLDERDRGGGKHELLRRATIGSLASILLHDIASSMQGLQSSVEVLCDIAGESPELQEVARDVAAASQATIASFVAIRKFVRTGELSLKRAGAGVLVAHAVRTARNPRADVRVEVGALSAGDVEVVVAAPLFEHILANLIAQAIAASPPGGAVVVDAARDGERVVFTVADGGASDELAVETFDPDGDDPVAVELAIAAHLAQLHGAALRLGRLPSRGRVFSVSLAAA